MRFCSVPVLIALLWWTSRTGLLVAIIRFEVVRSEHPCARCEVKEFQSWSGLPHWPAVPVLIGLLHWIRFGVEGRFLVATV